MNYAFIDSMGSLTYNNGIKIQAIMWKNGLEKLGHNVKLVNLWENIDFSSYDAVIIFAMVANIFKLIKGLSRINENIIVAPIIDPNRSDRFYKFLFKFYGSTRLALSNHYHDMWSVKEKVKLWLVRSEQERHYVSYCLDIPNDKIAKVPLNYRIPEIGQLGEKEDFCLHVSRLDAPNKNVPRLIEAAKKYGFDLKLAGHISGEKEEKKIISLIGSTKNIEYLGEVNEEELVSLYKRAKVFALPSLREGVGMAALEAAAYGCEIVLTCVGAPKEYYEGRALLVNPQSINEIGAAIIKAINKGYSQPELKSYIEKFYCEKVCLHLLNDSLLKLNYYS